MEERYQQLQQQKRVECQCAAASQGWHRGSRSGLGMQLSSHMLEVAM
jgi:hypothetical protein